jgi:hypothetical protein
MPALPLRPSISSPKMTSSLANTAVPALGVKDLAPHAVVAVLEAEGGAGGDFTRFCYTETADPLFGPSMLSIAASKADANTQRHLVSLPHFSGFWSAACAALAAQSGVRFCFAQDCTFFEKSTPDVTELACGLGKPGGDKQSKRFASHRRHAAEFGRERHHLAETLKLALISYPEADQLLFIDEFHYRAESQRLIAERLAERIG